MLSLGFWEIAVIVVLALVVVGPERLPRVMRYIGRQYGSLRRLADEMRRAMVLEADRQDAEERYEEMQRRREALQRAREEAEADGGVSQSQQFPVRVPDTDEVDRGEIPVTPKGETVLDNHGIEAEPENTDEPAPFEGEEAVEPAPPNSRKPPERSVAGE